jgi:predicted nucleic acid-binding protein
MSSKTPERIYIDSNVWFSYLTEGQFDREAEKASKIINSIIESSNKIAVINRLIILEVINVIRVRIVQRTQWNGNLSQDFEEQLRLKATNFIRKFIDIITKWAKSDKLEIFDSKMIVSDLLNKTVIIQDKLKGKFMEYDKCKICHRFHNMYNYKGCDHWDIQHAFIASEAKVNSLVTFDKGYEELKDYFNDFKITIY